MAKTKKTKKTDNAAEFFIALKLMEEERGIPKEFISLLIILNFILGCKRNDY